MSSAEDEKAGYNYRCVSYKYDGENLIIYVKNQRHQCGQQSSQLQ